MNELTRVHRSRPDPGLHDPGLHALARRAHGTDIDALAARSLPSAPRVAWDDVARL